MSDELTSPTDPNVFKPGSYFLSQIQGRTGKWVGIGQALTGFPSRWTHAGIIVGKGMVIEAAPGGARFAELAPLLDRDIMVCDGPVRMALANLGDNPDNLDEDALRDRVCSAAYRLVGTPYAWLDYLALALLHLGLPSKRVRRYVESSRSLICSALVDRAMSNAGVHLFHEGEGVRYPGDVMPSDLDTWHHEFEVHVTRGGPPPGSPRALRSRGGRHPKGPST